MPAPRFTRRIAAGERLGGFVYGTIVVLAVIVAGAKAYPDDALSVAGLVAGTTMVLWLAHVYAHGLARSVAQDKRLTPAELRQLAHEEASIVEAGVPSVLALVLGALGVLSDDTAVWAALGLALAVLVVEGLLFARIERFGPIATLGVVAANLCFGFLLVGLKLVIQH